VATKSRDSMTSTDVVNTLGAYCGVGCGMVLQVTTISQSDRRHVTKSIGNKEHPANFGRLCTKGATTSDLLAAPGRMEAAHLRADRGRPPEPVDMDRAITQAATRLRAIIDEHGPDSFAMYVSGQMSIEAQYLANKLTARRRVPHRTRPRVLPRPARQDLRAAPDAQEGRPAVALAAGRRARIRMR